MKYGIVGASGTLGRVTARQLLQADENTHVNALIRRPDADLESLDGCVTYQGGIFDDDQLARFVDDSDVVVNLAAVNPAGDDEDRRIFRDFFLVNGVGAAAVAAACSRQRRPLLHFSSVAVYETNVGPADEVARESDPLPVGDAALCEYFERSLEAIAAQFESHNGPTTDALNPFVEEMSLPGVMPVYGATKLLGETLARRFAEKICVVRMSDVYGPGHESRGVVTDHLNALRSGGPVVVDFGFRSSACFVFIDDVSQLISAGVERLAGSGQVPEIVNFVGERQDEASFAQVLTSLRASKGQTITPQASTDSSVKADRRYDGTTLKRFFTDFKATPFGHGMRLTWEKLQLHD